MTNKTGTGETQDGLSTRWKINAAQENDVRKDHSLSQKDVCPI